MDYLRRRVRGDSVFQIMVRPSEDGKQFLMTELPQPEIDPEMKGHPGGAEEAGVHLGARAGDLYAQPAG